MAQIRCFKSQRIAPIAGSKMSTRMLAKGAVGSGLAAADAIRGGRGADEEEPFLGSELWSDAVPLSGGSRTPSMLASPCSLPICRFPPFPLLNFSSSSHFCTTPVSFSPHPLQLSAPSVQPAPDNIPPLATLKNNLETERAYLYPSFIRRSSRVPRRTSALHAHRELDPPGHPPY